MFSHNTHKRIPTWAQQIIQDAQKYGAPNETSKESKRPWTHSSCVELLCDIIDVENYSYEEAIEKKEWKDVMIEKYQSIMNNGVWDEVLRPEGNYVVSSKWIYKIKHVAYGSIQKHKSRFVARGFFRKEGIYYEDTFALVARYTSIRCSDEV